MIEKKITVTAGKQEFTFNVSTGDYDRYINETQPHAKSAAAVNFLQRTLADKTQATALGALCDRGVWPDIVGVVIQEFRGDIEVAVKN